jgi:tryptophan synthase alpha chain
MKDIVMKDIILKNKVAEKFREIREKGGTALIPFIMAGDPDLAATFTILPYLEKGGADLIELGVPFSDPLADGPVIQEAAQRALAKVFKLRIFLRMLANNRGLVSVPLVLLVYYNLIYQYGAEQFLAEAVEAGIDGLVIPDLPPEEAGGLRLPAEKNGIALNMLVAPTSSPQRIKAAAALTTGFIYLVSVRGVTGERSSLPSDLPEFAGKVRELTGRPVAVGFGISQPAQAREISSFADGVIVGSALVRRLAAQAGSSPVAAGEEGTAFLRSLRQAMV